MPPPSRPLPTRRPGLWSDLARFVLRSPAEATRLDLAVPGKRETYDRRVLERLGVSVAGHEVLNIHRIGIDAPPELVWDELPHWSPDGGYWPGGIVRGQWEGEGLEHRSIRLLGLSFLPLFRLDLVRRQEAPPPTDPDRARYVLYRCSGGYPIGVFSIYVRDDGCGIDSQEVSGDAAGRVGLLVMRERAEETVGTVSVESAPGKGTQLIVTAPLVRGRNHSTDKEGDSYARAIS